MSPEIRIGGGGWKGRKVRTISGDYRPTTGIIKKSFFDSIGDDIEGSRFLDLFAGTGALGIEALSRGADFVVFIEKEWRQVKALQENLKNLEADQKSHEIIAMDYAYALSKLRERDLRFDLVYADPPYEGFVPRQVLGNIVTSGVLADDGLLIYETSSRIVRDILENVPEELYPVKERVHGGTALLHFRWRNK
ncbi:MAG: 16S rRNA (guanine(966)-N(2))-methyltransferase RsmD [bacterium]|nr:16S rRNA (guanine(966)-N(2))-methyltransferase RsmD [bacterium]